MKVNEVMVEEWLRNPVTAVVKEILIHYHGQLTDLNAADMYVPGDPHRSHEKCARMEIQTTQLQGILGMFEKEMLLEEANEIGQLQRDFASGV